MKPQYSCSPSPPSPPSKLTMHRDSHQISKFKPTKVRIVHVVAPEIIKTDAANFRDLVQSLTGKSSAQGGDQYRCRNLIKKMKKKSSDSTDPPRSKNLKKEDEDHEEGDDSSNNFLNECVNLDGFLQQILKLS